jgi:hypothetical protein
MDKEVIGVGQNSTLSECVKTSCSRFIYTDEFVEYRQQLLTKETTVAQLTQSAYENVKETEPQSTAVTQALSAQLSRATKLTKQALQEEKQALNISQLRNKLVMLDKSFDYKTLGFAKFSGFLKSIEGIQLIKQGTVDFVALKESKVISVATEMSLEDKYRSLLYKNDIRLIDVDKLKMIYQQMTSLESSFSTMALLKEAVLLSCQKKNGQIAKPDVNKAFYIFLRSNLILKEMPGSGDEFIKVKKLDAKDFMLAVDHFLLSALFELCRAKNVELKAKELKKLTLSSISKKEIKELINAVIN